MIADVVIILRRMGRPFAILNGTHSWLWHLGPIRDLLRYPDVRLLQIQAHHEGSRDDGPCCIMTNAPQLVSTCYFSPRRYDELAAHVLAQMRSCPVPLAMGTLQLSWSDVTLPLPLM